MDKVAVCVGYSFNLFSIEETKHIKLKGTGGYVNVNGVNYELHSAISFEESIKVDRLLDLNGELLIKEYREYRI